MEMSKAENAWFIFKDDNPDLFEAEWDSYESPINVIMSDVYTQLEVNLEKGVMSAIGNLGVDVNKDELIRALQYDREQYKKGYRDGYRTAKEEIVRCKDCRMYVENREAFVTYCERGLRDIPVRPDDFCSYGERKEK